MKCEWGDIYIISIVCCWWLDVFIVKIKVLFLKHFDVLMKKTPLAEVKSRVCCIKTFVRKSSLVCDYYSHIVFVINIAAIHSIKKDMYERFQVKVHEWKTVDKPIRTSTFFEMLLTFKMHKCIPLYI